MFQLTKRLRHAPLDELVGLLRAEADANEAFESRDPYALHQRNAPHVRYVLARLTDELGLAVTGEHTFDALTARNRRDPYEIEHIWANHHDRHVDEFASDQDFQATATAGATCSCCPRASTPATGDLPYEDKLPLYRGQNELAASLHPDTYQRNPNLRRWMEETAVPLEPHTRFPAASIDQRQDAYAAMARHIWNPDRLFVLP